MLICAIALALLSFYFLPSHKSFQEDTWIAQANVDLSSKAHTGPVVFFTIVCGDEFQDDCPFTFRGLEELVGVRIQLNSRSIKFVLVDPSI